MAKKKATQRLSASPLGRSPPQSSSSQSVIFDQEEENNNSTSNNDGRPAEPPPYSISSFVPISSISSSPSQPRGNLPNGSSFIQSRSPFLPRLNYTKYSIPESALSKDGTTITTYHPAFTSNSEALVRFIREQAALPPLPYIHIVGGQQDSCTNPDFDIKLNMLPYFMSSTATSQSQSQGQSDNNIDHNGWNYLKLVTDDELAFRGKNRESLHPTVPGGLEEWARRFCNETSTLKS